MSFLEDLVLNSPFSLEQLTMLFVLGLARVLPLFTYVPFIGANLLPKPVKMGFAICLVAVLLPQLLGTASSLPPFGFAFLGLLAKEFMLGMGMGYLASIPFQIVTTSGILIDNQRGTGSMSIRDPSQGVQSSPIGTLYNHVLTALFYQVGGLPVFLQTLVDSYRAVPIDHYLHAGFFQFNAVWMFILQVMTKLMALALQLAAPPFLAMLMTDLFLGICNRLAPQVQIAFLGMSLKSLIAITMLFIGWKLIMTTTLATTQQWMGMLPVAWQWASFYTTGPGG